MGTPLVTVVITSYNQGPYLEEALQSCLAQNYPHQEHVFINNGSTDNTDQLFAHYQKSWPHPLRYLNNASNLGICKAFNKGLQTANGKYIVDLAADDVLLPDRLGRQVEFFEQCPDDTGMVHGNHEIIDVSGKKLGSFHPKSAYVPQGDIYTAIMHRMFVSPPSMMFKTDVLKSLNGYDESLLFEDNDIILRIARYYKIFYHNEILTKKRQVPNSLSDTYNKANINEALSSILIMLKKVQAMNRDKNDYRAFQEMLGYYVRYALRHKQAGYASKYSSLLEKPGKHKYLIKLQSKGWPIWWFLRRLSKE